MPKYYLEHYGFIGDEENSLMHYGIKGMRWRHHKVKPGMGDHDRAEYYRTQGEKRNRKREAENEHPSYSIGHHPPGGARGKAMRLYDYVEGRRGGTGSNDPWSSLKREMRVQNLHSNEDALNKRGLYFFYNSNSINGQGHHNTKAVYVDPNNSANNAIVDKTNRQLPQRKPGVTANAYNYTHKRSRRKSNT